MVPFDIHRHLRFPQMKNRKVSLLTRLLSMNWTKNFDKGGSWLTAALWCTFLKLQEQTLNFTLIICTIKCCLIFIIFYINVHSLIKSRMRFHMSCVVFVAEFDQNLLAGYVLNKIKIIFTSPNLMDISSSTYYFN